MRAIVAKHTEYIRERRLELIDELDVRYGPVDVRSAVRVLVEPITTPLEHGRSGRAFAQLLPRVLTPLDRTTVRVDAGKLVRERLDVLILQIAHSVSDRARIEDRPDAKWPLSPLDLFVSNLVDMFVAALVGPASAATMQALRRRASSKRAR